MEMLRLGRETDTNFAANTFFVEKVPSDCQHPEEIHQMKAKSIEPKSQMLAASECCWHLRVEGVDADIF